MGDELVVALDGECDDALAALGHLRSDPLVDADRAMLGSSFCGVMSGVHVTPAVRIWTAGVTWASAALGSAP